MTRLQHLKEQAARAERIARAITDTLTIERLLSFADDCRRQIETLNITQLAETHRGDISQQHAARTAA
jgi:hypothetical protein